MAKRRTDRHPSPQQPAPPAPPTPAQDELGELGQMPNFSLDEPTAPPGAAFELSALEDPNKPQFPLPTAVPVDPRSIDPSKPPMVAKLAKPVQPAAPSSGVFEVELAEAVEVQPASDVMDAEVFEAEPASAIIEAVPASDVIEAEPASAVVAQPESAVVEAAPASDVVGAEPASAVVAEPASAVIEAAPASDVVEVEAPSAVVAEPASAVIEAAPASDVVEVEAASAVVAEPASAVIEAAPASDVVEVEPASAVAAEPASAVIEAVPASDVVEVEAASAVVAEPASAVIEAVPESDVVEVEPASAVVAQPASAVIEAAPASEVVEAAPASAVLDAEVFADDEASADERSPAGGVPSSSVFAAELVAESAPSSKSKRAASDVLAAEFADKPSSVSKKKPVQPASKAKKPAPPPPSSDVFAAEFLEDVTPAGPPSSPSKAGSKSRKAKSDEPASAILAEPASAVVEAEPASGLIAQPASAVVEAEPASGLIAQPASDIVEVERELADEPIAAAEPASAVVEAEPVSGLIAQPASDIVEVEPELADEPIAAAEPASAVVEAEAAFAVVEAEEPAASDEAEPGYGVIEPEEPAEQEPVAAEAASAVVEAEPASAVVEAAEELEEDVEPLVAEPASAVVEAEPASAVVEAGEELNEDVEPLVAEPASAVVEAEPTSAVVEAAEDEDVEPLVAEPVSAVVAAEPASAVVEAAEELDEDVESLVAEPASAVVEAEPASAVIEAAEELAVEPLVAEPASAVAEAEPVSAVVAEAESAIVAAEPASAVAEAEPASAVFAEEAEPASAVVAEAESAIVAAEPASAIAEAEPASAIAEAEEAALADEALIAGESASSKIEAPSAPRSPAGKKRKHKGKKAAEAPEVEWDEALPEELASSEIAWESEEEEEIPKPIPILDDDLSDETVAFEPLPEKNKLLMSTEEDEALSWDAPPSSASRKQEAPSSRSRKKETPSSISRKQEAPSSKSKKKEAPSSRSKKQEAPSSKSKKQSAPSSAARKKVEEKSAVKKPGKQGVMAEVDEDIIPAAEPIEEASILEDEEIAVAAEPSSVALVAEEVVEDEPEEIAEAEEVVEAETEDEVAEAEEDFTEVCDEETVAEALEDDEIAEAEEIEEEEIAEAEEEVEEEIAEAEEEEAQPARKRGQRVAAAESDEETIGEDEITEAEDEETIAEAEDEEIAEAEDEEIAEAEDEEIVEAEDEEIAEAEDEEIAEAEDEEIAEAEDEEDVVTEFEEGEEYAATEDEDDSVTQFEEDEEIAEDEEFAAKPGAKKKRGKQALADEEEEPIPAKKKKGKAKLLTAIEPEEEEFDEELTEAEAEEEPMPAGKRGKKPAASYMEVDEEEGAVAVLKRRPKPKYGRRWLGGMILGWLLLGGAGYGVWHFAPHLIKQAYAQIPLEKDPDDPIQLARDHMNEFKYAKALVDLRDQDKTPLVLAMRGEARWLNYLQENKGKATLNPKDADVEQAIKELTEAKNDALVMQIQKTLEATGPKDEPAQLQDLAKSMRNMLVKSKEIAAGDDTKTFAATLQEVLKKRLEFEEKYNGVAKVLADGKFIADKSKVDLDEFEKLMKDLASNRTALENVNKLLEKAEFKDPGEKGVEKLIAAWTDLVNKVADVNKLLADAKTKGDGAKGVKELIDARANLETERDGLETLIKQAVKELVDANAVPAGGDTHKDLMQGLKIIRVKAESPLGVPLTYFASSMMSVGTGVARFLDSKLENVALQAELRFYQIREPLIDTPEQKLEMFVSLLQDRRQKDPDLLRRAERDASWLLSKDAASNLEIRGKASYLRALAYRNQLKFAEAKKALEDALEDGKAARLVNAKKADVWLNPIKETQRELTDPTAYYLPRVARMQAAGYWQMAVDELTLALTAMPDDGRLLARRAYARFELVRSEPKYITGKFTKEQREAIRGDADLAAKAPEAAGEANYVLGLVEEELGNFTLAEQNYRKAIKAVEAAKGPADEIGKIRIALARLLQRPTSTGPESHLSPPDAQIRGTAFPGRPLGDSVGASRDDGHGGHADGLGRPSHDHPSEATVIVHPLSMLLAATIVAAQPGAIDDDDDPAAKIRLKESEDIAKELMMSDNPKIKGQGHLLLGQVLAKKGRRTEGLRVYIEGLKLIYPGRETSELIKMMEEHPIFQLPDVTTRPNPFLADYHYSEGLRRYWERDFITAEKHLKMAATYNDRYAPYFYFLGLSQLAQKTRLKRDAADLAFTKAGKLEAKNLPNYSEVNQNLERIQGELRVYLNRYRMGGVNEFDRLDK